MAKGDPHLSNLKLHAHSPFRQLVRPCPPIPSFLSLLPVHPPASRPAHGSPKVANLCGPHSGRNLLVIGVE